MQLDQRRREPAPVAVGDEHHLRGFVQTFVEAAVADHGAVRRVGRRDELLQVRELVDARVRVAELGVHLGVLHLLAHHHQVRHERLVVVAALGDVDDVAVVGGVAGFDVRGDGGAHVARRELRFGELAPHLGGVHALRVLQAALDGLEALQQHFHRVEV